ncbi:MAG: nicotinamide mononucleotide transporter [Lentisphaerae bacterium]|nr:nicotinamide mononucleotide transporter [Lentisphaerota bacterium]
MLNVLKKFIIREFSNWHYAEWLWMLFCVASTVVISLHLGDNWLGTAAAVTGVLYSLWAGKGKLSCYFFGIFNSIAYGWLSYRATLYGEVALNWGWYLPMMFAGLFFWKRNLKKEVQEIVKRALSWRGRLLTALIAAAGTAAAALVLHKMGDQAPVLDAFTTVLSVIAMALTVKRCMEQWMLWTLVNLASIYMWYRVYQTGSGSVAVLMMWVLNLLNGILFYYLWQKEIKKCPTEN